jgi:two-component system cell cycle sensor histidine kinase/response regulator CckA
MTRKSPVTILLVDDDPLIRTLGQELLESLGYRVATAGDGPEARQVCRRLGAVDLVILDYSLPGAEGGQVLRELAVAEGLRVLVASGFFSPQDAARLRKMGAAGLICKPFRLAELQERIREVLAGESAA